MQKIRNATASYKKGADIVVKALKKIDIIIKISKSAYYIGIKDYTKDLIKLNIIIEALEKFGDEDMLNAANLMKLEMTNYLYRVADQMIEVGTDLIFGCAKKYISSFTKGIKSASDAVVCIAYIYNLDIALSSYNDKLMNAYLIDGNISYLNQIKENLHISAYCRAMLNTMTIDIYKMFPMIPHTNQEALRKYANYYISDELYNEIEQLFD